MICSGGGPVREEERRSYWWTVSKPSGRLFSSSLLRSRFFVDSWPPSCTQKSDHIMMQLERKTTIQAIRASSSSRKEQESIVNDQEDCCPRGLEKFTRSAHDSESVRANQVAVVQSVLQVQEEQRMMNIQDDIGIRVAARAVSKWAIQKALERARLDAIEADIIATRHQNFRQGNPSHQQESKQSACSCPTTMAGSCRKNQTIAPTA